MQETICHAIHAKQLLMVKETKSGCTYERVVEPYLLFATKAGNLVLHSWQVEGDYDKTAPPDWCNLRLSDIDAIAPLERFYGQPHQKYNPHNQYLRQLHKTEGGWRGMNTA